MARIAADPASPATGQRPRRVLVTYEASADGHAALSHAVGIASAARAPLTVVVIVPHERENVGCARCRSNAAMWNRELEAIAKEELAEAARLVGGMPTVEYEVARGPRATAIAESASRCGADLIVLPWRRPARIWRMFARDVGEPLRRAGRWQVVVEPAAAGRTPVQGCPGRDLTDFRRASGQAQRPTAVASSTRSRQVRSGGANGSG
jgi:nucleotide-binding universal stress UspA family protein